jgi:predicted membrane protein
MNRNFISVLFGLFLVVVGTSALLKSFGITQFDYYLRTFWPLFIIGLAASRLAVKDVKGGIIMGFIGVIAQLNTLNITNVNFFSLIFPILLIFIGISTLAKAFTFKKNTGDGTVLSETTIFSGLEKVITDQAFESGSLMTFFGAIDLDFRKAKMAEQGAVIDVLIGFGGGEIKVSSDVRVEMEVTALFGGSEDKHTILEGVKPTQTLRIKGYVLFGALEVKS